MTESENIRLLLVEDDRRLAQLMRDYIESQGYKVTTQYRGDLAVEEFLPQKTDIVILDLMLPGLDGLQVCQQIRQRFDGPILILTAKKSDIDHVMGLELGADNFITKPVEPTVLLAHLRALMRRVTHNGCQAESTGEVNELHFGQLCLNRKAQQVVLNHQTIELTTQEFELLWLLAENAGTVLSRDRIFSSMRGIEYDGMDRTVDVRISRLRRKLKDNAEQPQRLKTIWGKGYLFVADAWV